MEAVLGIFFGGLVGWVITHIYYKKVTPTERIAKDLRKGLQQALFPIIHPEFYGDERNEVIPEPPPPINKDIPHVVLATFDSKNIKANQTVKVLLKIEDSGLNFDNPTGVAVRDHHGVLVPLRFAGFGFVILKFQTKDGDQAGQHSLSVVCTDTGQVQNQLAQSLSFYITT
jgi:hypothetical protein